MAKKRQRKNTQQKKTQSVAKVIADPPAPKKNRKSIKKVDNTKNLKQTRQLKNKLENALKKRANAEKNVATNLLVNNSKKETGKEGAKSSLIVNSKKKKTGSPQKLLIKLCFCEDKCRFCKKLAITHVLTCGHGSCEVCAQKKWTGRKTCGVCKKRMSSKAIKMLFN